MDDPTDTCNPGPRGGGADCTGFCIEECGGFFGKACSDDDAQCVDSPFDSCDPTKGGADCGGVCVSDDNGYSKSNKVVVSKQGRSEFIYVSLWIV